jgi:hypothetical protein
MYQRGSNFLRSAYRGITALSDKLSAKESRFRAAFDKEHQFLIRIEEALPRSTAHPSYALDLFPAAFQFGGYRDWSFKSRGGVSFDVMEKLLQVYLDYAYNLHLCLLWQPAWLGLLGITREKTFKNFSVETVLQSKYYRDIVLTRTIREILPHTELLPPQTKVEADSAFLIYRALHGLNKGGQKDCIESYRQLILSTRTNKGEHFLNEFYSIKSSGYRLWFQLLREAGMLDEVNSGVDKNMLGVFSKMFADDHQGYFFHSGTWSSQFRVRIGQAVKGIQKDLYCLNAIRQRLVYANVLRKMWAESAGELAPETVREFSIYCEMLRELKGAASLFGANQKKDWIYRMDERFRSLVLEKFRREKLKSWHFLYVDPKTNEARWASLKTDGKNVIFTGSLYFWDSVLLSPERGPDQEMIRLLAQANPKAGLVIEQRKLGGREGVESIIDRLRSPFLAYAPDEGSFPGMVI